MSKMINKDVKNDNENKKIEEQSKNDESGQVEETIKDKENMAE